jgi:hypothetical protein
MFKHGLGIEVKTKVSKLMGIVTSRSQCLYGCNRYFVQPPVDKDMKQPDGWWVDEDDIEVVGEGVHAIRRNTGGMMSRTM